LAVVALLVVCWVLGKMARIRCPSRLGGVGQCLFPIRPGIQCLRLLSSVPGCSAGCSVLRLMTLMIRGALPRHLSLVPLGRLGHLCWSCRVLIRATRCSLVTTSSPCTSVYIWSQSGLCRVSSVVGLPCKPVVTLPPCLLDRTRSSYASDNLRQVLNEGSLPAITHTCVVPD